MLSNDRHADHFLSQETNDGGDGGNGGVDDRGDRDRGAPSWKFDLIFKKSQNAMCFLNRARTKRTEMMKLNDYETETGCVLSRHLSTTKMHPK